MLSKIENEKPNKGLEQFTEEFFLDRSRDLDEMIAALGSDDLETVRKHAHRWKGFSEPYGFDHLEMLAIEIEIECARDNHLKVSELLKSVSEYLEQKKNFLNF